MHLLFFPLMISLSHTHTHLHIYTHPYTKSWVLNITTQNKTMACWSIHILSSLALYFPNCVPRTQDNGSHIHQDYLEGLLKQTISPTFRNSDLGSLGCSPSDGDPAGTRTTKHPFLNTVGKCYEFCKPSENFTIHISILQTLISFTIN